MTTKQRMSILVDRWPAACRAQGWDRNDRSLRLRVISQAIGRWVKTMNDLNNTSDIDAVYAHLGLLCDNVGLTQETLPAAPITVAAGRGQSVTKPATAGERRRILWKIREYAAPLGGDPYIRQIVKCNPGLVQGWTTLDDLSTKQLHQLMTTLARCASHKLKDLSDKSYTSEETFPDQVAFQQAPEPELVSGPF
jgi:hypothetical protein